MIPQQMRQMNVAHWSQCTPCTASRSCRVSTQITGKPASVRALNSHCDSGPAYSPIRLKSAHGVRQHPQQRFGFARNLHFPDDPVCTVHNAQARLLHRHVESSKIIHAALLLLMLEAPKR
jgi:hypothetical protein